jgi:hypothetical protein
MRVVVRVWIGKPYEDGKFNGTAFFIDAQTLITAKHVVTNRAGETYQNIFLGNTPDGGIIPIDEVKICTRDLAILKVKKSFSIEHTPFTKEIKEGSDVTLIGFYDNDSSQKTYQNRISGYQSLEHTYELQNHLTNGLSGCPVFFNGKICGVAKAINMKKNITYIIPITELCMDTEAFFKEKEMPKKKLTLEEWASIAGIGGTVIALLAWLLPLLFKPSNIEFKSEPIVKLEEQKSQQDLESNSGNEKIEFDMRISQAEISIQIVEEKIKESKFRGDSKIKLLELESELVDRKAYLLKLKLDKNNDSNSSKLYASDIEKLEFDTRISQAEILIQIVEEKIKESKFRGDSKIKLLELESELVDRKAYLYKLTNEFLNKNV